MTYLLPNDFFKRRIAEMLEPCQYGVFRYRPTGRNYRPTGRNYRPRRQIDFDEIAGQCTPIRAVILEPATKAMERLHVPAH